MRIVTSNRQITSFTSTHVDDVINNWKANTDIACFMKRSIKPTSQWDQIGHNEFVAGVNSGKLMPLWCTDPSDLGTYVSGSSQAVTVPSSSNSAKCLFIMPMWQINGNAGSIHTFDTRGTDVHINNATRPPLEITSQSGVFPVTAIIQQSGLDLNGWSYVNRKPVQLVGAIEWAYGTPMIVSKNNSAYYHSTWIYAPVPSTWQQLRAALDTSFSTRFASENVVHSEYVAHKTHYLDTICKPIFDAAKNSEGVTFQPFCVIPAGHVTTRTPVGPMPLFLVQKDHLSGTAYKVRQFIATPDMQPGELVHLPANQGVAHVSSAGNISSSMDSFDAALGSSWGPGLYTTIDSLDEGLRRIGNVVLDQLAPDAEVGSTLHVDATKTHMSDLGYPPTRVLNMEKVFGTLVAQNYTDPTTSWTEQGGQVLDGNGNPLDTNAFTFPASIDAAAVSSMKTTSTVWRQCGDAVMSSLKSRL